MQYSIDQLDDAIHYYLLTKPNTWISEHTIFNDLCEKKICPDLNDMEMRTINKRLFKSQCRSLINRNISQHINKKTLYMKFELNNKPNKEIEQLKRLFHSAVSNNMVFTKHTNSTIIHEICRNNLCEEFEKCGALSINPLTRNSKGETLFDVVNPRTSSGMKMMKIIIIMNERYIMEIETEKDELINKLLFAEQREKKLRTGIKILFLVITTLLVIFMFYFKINSLYANEWLAKCVEMIFFN